MKVINENLEIIDYEEKEETKTGDMFDYKLIARMTLINLIYEMNKNTHHKMNFIIVGMQFLIICGSIISQFIFNNINSTLISTLGAVASIMMMCLVIINNKISDKAIKRAHEQKEIIEKCIDKIIEGTKNEYSK